MTEVQLPIVQHHQKLPKVSLLTPTYNRRSFLPWIIKVVQAFNYPTELMEWIIIDDTPSGSSKDLFDGISYCKYLYLDQKISLPAKRNLLNNSATGDILICLDDDDYYPPERIMHVVNVLTVLNKPRIAGSKNVHVYFAQNKEIWHFTQVSYGCASMAYTKSYAMTHTFSSKYQNVRSLNEHDREKAINSFEEASFIGKSSVIELDPLQTMLVIAHSSNTIDKYPILSLYHNNQLHGTTGHLTGFVLKNFIINEELRS